MTPPETNAPVLVELSSVLRTSPDGKPFEGIPVLVAWTDLERGWCAIKAKGAKTLYSVTAQAKCPEWYATELQRAREAFAAEQKKGRAA